jgi:predicted dinucleotide-binding enzyme
LRQIAGTRIGEKTTVSDAIAEFGKQARAIGPTVVAKSLRDVAEADTIIFAIPSRERRKVAKTLPV